MSGAFIIDRNFNVLDFRFNPKLAAWNTEQRTENMARIDDYIQAKNLAVERLQSESFDNLVQRSGFETFDAHSFKAPLFDRSYQIRYPSFEIQDIADERIDPPIQEHLLILHYMKGTGTERLTGTWITYREIPEASFYFSVFVKRAIDPLKTAFGQNLLQLATAALQLNGRAISHGDVAFEFYVFPKVPIQVILWEGDDEFPPEANILFDKSISKILSPEDIAWLSGMLVYRLIAVTKGGR